MALSKMARVNVGVIGCGKAGQAHLHWYAQNPACRIVGVYDPDKNRSQAVAKEHDAVAFASWQEIASHPGVSLVSVCGPESVRAQQSVFVSQQGNHSLCEKPLANSLAECDRMIDAAESGNVFLMTFFNMRFHPVVDAVGQVLDQIGPIYALRLDYTQFRTTVGWRHKIEQGGGVLKSQGVHPIDLATYWAGPAATVSGEMSVVHPQRAVEDLALIMLRFQSGAVGEIYTCYTDRQEEAMYGSLHGMKGRLTFRLSPYQPELNQVQLQATGESGIVPLRAPDVIDPVYPGLQDCSKRAIDHFVACVAARRPSHLNGQLGRQAIEIVLAGYESQRRGGKVALPLEESDTGDLRACFPRFDTKGYGFVD